MSKRIVALILFALMLISGYLPIATAHNAPFPPGYTPTTANIDTIAEPDTLDPAWCYDTASAGVIMNVYEPLIFYDVNPPNGPYSKGLIDSFRPMLATDVAVKQGPAPYPKTFYFRVRGQATGIDTFVTTANPVDLFKDGQIYGTKLFVRDPDYGMAGTTVGPITLPSATPAYDLAVDRSNVPGLEHTRRYWSRTYGGASTDRAYSVVQTSDGGYAIAGETYSFGIGTPTYLNAYLVKTNSAGTVQWSQTYGGTGNDGAYSVVQTDDGGYALAGWTQSSGAGGSDFWLVKTDSDGNTQWPPRTYGGTGGDVAHTVVQTADGGYALAGTTNSYGAGSYDFWLVKTASDGTMEWSQTYGGTGADYANSMVQTADGGYALTGYTNSFGAGGYDFWLVKTDSDGNTQWPPKTYGGTDNDYAYSVVQTSDGGYAIAGQTYSYGAGGSDFWLVKTDSDGNTQWPSPRTYGGTGADSASSVVQTSDGGYALAGGTYSYGAGDYDFWLVKTDSAGTMEWSKTYGGTSSDYAWSLVQTSDGEYALAGWTFSFGAGGGDFWLVKTTWGDPTDTTWLQTTAGNRGHVIRGWTDANSNNVIDAGDIIRFVRKEEDIAGATMARWNVAEYYLVTGVTSTFPYTITATKQPVRFHDGNMLTTADVAYSLWRWLVQDRDGGPQWMLYYPVFNTYGADLADSNFGLKIRDHIEYNATHVWTHLDNDYPEGTFLQIMCQAWATVVEKSWAVSLGDFDGDWTRPWNDGTPNSIVAKWHNPSASFIKSSMMGTGPYKFSYWTPLTAWSIVKFDGYWDGWPSLIYPTGTQRLPSIPGKEAFLSSVTWNLIPLWEIRRPRFLAGVTDFTYVPKQYRDQILGQEVGGELIRCFYPVQPLLQVDAVFFNFDVSTSSPYLGPGFDPSHPYVIAEDRSPINLFSDIHVRRGFRYIFDFLIYLSMSWLNECTQPADPIISGLPYDNPANALPIHDDTAAWAELKQAWIGHPDDDPLTPEGALYDKGMSLTILYNDGDISRDVAAEMLKNELNQYPKFHVSTQALRWGDQFLPGIVAREFPVFVDGWSADYPDPDDFAFPFMHSLGTKSQWQGYNNPRVDELIEWGALNDPQALPYNGELDMPNLAALNAVFNNPGGIPPDTRWPRRSVYYELQAIYTEDIPSFTISQINWGRHFEQAWVRGWYHNLLYGGSQAAAIYMSGPESPVLYFYHLWKAQTHFGDANNDGVVNVLDITTVSASWTKPAPTSPVGPLGYTTQADMTGGSGATFGDVSGLVVGIPDGKVGIVDASLVSSYWDGPPQGPSHP